MKGLVPVVLILVSNQQVRCDDSSELSSLVENRFEEDTEYCKKSAEDVHANSVDPTRELNHFLLCLSKKAKIEVRE